MAVKVEGISIRSGTQLRNKIGLAPVGKTVRLTLERDGGSRDILVEVDLALER